MKFINLEGLSIFWNNIKSYINTEISSIPTEDINSLFKSNIIEFNNEIIDSDVYMSYRQYSQHEGYSISSEILTIPDGYTLYSYGIPDYNLIYFTFNKSGINILQLIDDNNLDNIITIEILPDTFISKNESIKYNAITEGLPRESANVYISLNNDLSRITYCGTVKLKLNGKIDLNKTLETDSFVDGMA